MKVRCVEAKERGISLVEGQIYTVKSQFVGNQSTQEATIPGMEDVPGYTLVEIPGYFRADRFETVL
jgi:hypothetical protein